METQLHVVVEVPPSPRVPQPQRERRCKGIYIFTLIGGLKLAIFIIGIIVVYVGVNGVLTSFFHLQFHNGQIVRSEYNEKETWTSGNQSAACQKMRLELQNDKKVNKKFKGFKLRRILKVGIEAKAEVYRLDCLGILPSWVTLDYYFITAAITCLVMESASLVLGIFREDLVTKYKNLDAALHGFLGVMLLAGLICLFVAMGEKMDEGAEQLIFGAREIHDIAQRTFDFQQKRREQDHGSDLKKKQEDEDNEKRELEKRHAEAAIQDRIPKTWFAYNERIVTAVFGFLNCALYFFTASIIGRGISSDIPFW